MDDDWEQLAEKENVVIAPKVPKNVNKWEGEDEDEEVKESWEDEEEKKDEEKIKENEVAKNVKPKPKKAPGKLSEKEKEKSDLEEKSENEILANMTPEEKLAEKLRLQQIQKEEDLKTAMETFGVTETPSGLDGMHPTNKAEFFEFAQAISNKVSVYKNDEDFPGFVEELVRNICVNLNPPDLKKLKITVDNIYLEKQKMEKEKTKKPSTKGKTKVKLRMEEDNVKTNNIGNYGYEDFDDYDDFM